MDLLTYLQNYEPSEPVHVSGGEYTTRTHNSLRISKKCDINDRIIAYLMGRGIVLEILNNCIDKSLIYESRPPTMPYLSTRTRTASHDTRCIAERAEAAI